MSLFDELQHFKSPYIAECYDLLADMEERLLSLEEGSSDMELLNAAFRDIHSIKGGAGAFGLTHIAQFAHKMEALLGQLRSGNLRADKSLIDLLLSARDTLLSMLNAARDHAELPKDFGEDIATQLVNFYASIPVAASSTPYAKDWIIHFTPHAAMIAHGSDPLQLLREIAKLGGCYIRTDTKYIPSLESFDPEQSYLSWELTLSTLHSEAELHEVFEFVEDECELAIRPAVALSAQQPLVVNTPGAVSTSSIRVDTEKLDHLINMVGEIVIAQAMLAMQSRDLPQPQYVQLTQGIAEMAQYTRELQEGVMAVRMQAVNSIFARMPRLVRDLASQTGKSVKLLISGENTEVDKTIIEHLSDPLTHMIRNAVDHGIEPEAERIKAGKPATASIRLHAAHQGGCIVIEVQDDGSGLPRDKLLAHAKECKIFPADAIPNDTDIDQLIFLPGFSTATEITAISGRGVGMDVVRRNIERLGGYVRVSTIPGHGTLFTLALPLTLAMLDGMIVCAGEEHYIIPITHIVQTLTVKSENVHRLVTNHLVISLADSTIPVLNLAQLMGAKPRDIPVQNGLIVLCESGQERLGIAIDEIVGQQQIVIKTLEDNTDPVPGIAGATILGDGQVSLILDIAGLARMAQPKSRVAA